MKAPLCPKCGDPCVKHGNARGKQRWGHGGQKARACSWQGTQPVFGNYKEPGIDAKTSKALHDMIRKGAGGRYLVTAAQNATAVYEPFFSSLLTYCRINNAQLIVIPYRYKNPTSYWSKAAEHDDWWTPELVPFLLDKRVKLCKGLVLLADIKTQPTASCPLQGFETITGPDSAIIGHPKLELATVATPQSALAKLLTTTGAVTVPNYLSGKAGKKGEHHHTFGACLVEHADGLFHIRQINATRDGTFQDLNWMYTAEGRKSAKIEALITGDSHVEFIDPAVVGSTYTNPDSIVKTLRPRYLVWHDVWDMYSRSHHHSGNPFIEYAKHHAGANNVEASLDAVFSFIDDVTPSGTKNVIVASNHPDAFSRWVREADPKKDPVNCVFWAKTFTAMCLGSDMTPAGVAVLDPFEWWGRRKLKSISRTKFVKRNHSFILKGVELGFHGDQGANGARGSRKSYSRIGVKSIIGHSHSPGITDGAYQVGTSSRLSLEYNTGPSSWMQAHCLLYENGKRSLIFIVKGKWRT